MTVHHVLVPIDFSPYAEHALDYAIALAQKLQARVTLLHVIQPPLVAGADMGVWPSPAFVDELEAAIMGDMEGYLARVTAAGLAGEIAVVHCVPFQEIIDTAKARQVDLTNSTVSELPCVYVQWSQAVTLFPMIKACKFVALQTPFAFMQ